MIRRIVVLAVCTLLFAPAVGTASAQQRGKARAGAQMQAQQVFDGELARHFSADTLFYVEVSDLTAAAEEMGGADLLYATVDKLIGEGIRTGARKPALTLEQFKSMMGSTLAIGVRMPNLASKPRDPGADAEIVGLLRAPSGATAQAMVKYIEDLNAAVSHVKRQPPKKQTLKGVVVTTYPDATVEQSFAWARMNDTIVFGSAPAVTRAVQGVGRVGASNLGDNPGYRSAVDRAGSHNVFAYLNGAPFVKAFNEGLESNLGTQAKPPTKEQLATIKVLKALFGMEAVRGGSLSALVANGKIAVRGGLEIDRSRSGLVTTVTSPPEITLRSAAMLPQETDGISATSLDLVALYDLVASVVTPEVTRDLGTPSFDESVGQAEAFLGAKLRDEIFASIGPELSFSMILPEKADTMAVQDPPAPAAKPSPDFVGMVEVRDVELIKRVVSNVAAVGNNGKPLEPRVYRDVEVWSTGSAAWTFLNGFLVFGEQPEVHAVIDAVSDNRVLTATSYYTSATGAIPTDTIFGMYFGPDVFEEAAQSATGRDAEALPLDFVKNGLFVSVQKDSGGIFTTIEVPVPNLRLLLKPDRKTQARLD